MSALSPGAAVDDLPPHQPDGSLLAVGQDDLGDIKRRLRAVEQDAAAGRHNIADLIQALIDQQDR